MRTFTLLAALSVSWCLSAQAAKPTPTYVAKVKYLEVSQNGQKTSTLATEVKGEIGTPLKTDLGGQNGTVVKLEMRDVADTRPRQYIAEFKIVRVGDDGKESTLSAPKLTVLAGKPAHVMVGEEKGDRIEVDLTVSEAAAGGK